MREATSRVLIAELLARGATISAYDPAARDEAQRIYADTPRFTLAGKANEALKDADALVVVTEWKEFRCPDFVELKALLKTPAIFDGRNLYESALLKEHDLEHYPIGR